MTTAGIEGFAGCRTSQRARECLCISPQSGRGGTPQTPSIPAPRRVHGAGGSEPVPAPSLWGRPW